VILARNAKDLRSLVGELLNLTQDPPLRLFDVFFPAYDLSRALQLERKQA
jgi:hypothetical protein